MGLDIVTGPQKCELIERIIDKSGKMEVWTLLIACI
mgnify:CR=1 FL=1|jgi:hypothetical protein